jgi:hypothetical protein
MGLHFASSRFFPSALVSSLLLLSANSVFGAEADKANVVTCPPVDPNADFLTNFNQPCYTTSLYAGKGLNLSGDGNAVYDTMDYVVTPGYELILLGTYPNARFFSATVYDSHLAITSSVIDQNILPLNSTMYDPFLVGAVWQPGLQYGITIGFGSTVTSTPTAGCSASDTTIDQNFLDASQIHQGLSWNNFPGISQYNLPAHQSGANNAGILMVRKYVIASPTSPETIIVRSTATGCAIPASQALSMGILVANKSLSWPLLAQQQITAHQNFSNGVEQLECYKSDPTNIKQWFRSVDYVPLASEGSALDANLTTTNIQQITSGQEFIRLRFPAPTTPTTPCASGCALTGNEDLRYYSISFLGGSIGYGLSTLTSLGDSSFLQDPNGNVTLLINIIPGATPPSFVTSSNFYNYLDLTQVPNYQNFSRIEIRHLLPNINFNCSIASIANFYMEYNSEGGYMGQYVPTIDFPTALELAAPAPPPPTRLNTCPATPGIVPGDKACGPSNPYIYPTIPNFN